MKLKNQAAWVFRKSTKSLIQPPSGILCCSRKSMAKAPPSSPVAVTFRSEEHTSELQSLMRISYAVFCLKKKKTENKHNNQLNKMINNDPHNTLNAVQSTNN